MIGSPKDYGAGDVTNCLSLLLSIDGPEFSPLQLNDLGRLLQQVANGAEPRWLRQGLRRAAPPAVSPTS
jgi:hypothetical protein